MKIEVNIGKGIVVNGTAVHFNEPISKLPSILGAYEQDDDSYYFCDSNIMVNTDADKIVEIELRGGADSEIQAVLNGVSVFEEEKSKVLEMLRELNRDELLEEVGSLTASNIGISVSSELSEEDVEEMIRESKKDGVYEEMLEDIQRDIYRSKHIEAICITAG